MIPARRWFQYSLRSFLILLTALAVWLGVVVNRAREQREAVKAIEALGGHIIYDWSIVEWHDGGTYTMDIARKPPAPVWLRRIIGDDFFQDAVVVHFWGEWASHEEFEERILDAVPHLQRLRRLKTAGVFFSREDLFSTATIEKVKSALPDCELK